MESKLQNNLGILLEKLEDFITTKTVVGQPIHVGETILLPLVDVSFGVAAGASATGDQKKETQKDDGAGGLGAKITPSAILVIQGGTTQLVNIKKQDSVNKLIDMVPGILSKLNIDFGKSKEKKMKEDEMRNTVEQYYREKTDKEDGQVVEEK